MSHVSIHQAPYAHSSKPGPNSHASRVELPAMPNVTMLGMAIPSGPSGSASPNAPPRRKCAALSGAFGVGVGDHTNAFLPTCYLQNLYTPPVLRRPLRTQAC